MKFLILILTLCALCLAQSATINGVSGMPHQTGIGSVILTPVVVLVPTYDCVPTAGTVAGNWTGAAFDCTMTIATPAPVGGYSKTLNATQNGVLVPAINITPNPVVIAAGQTSATFVVKGP